MGEESEDQSPKKHHPTSLMTREFLWLVEIGEVFVVHEQGDGMTSSLEIMTPVFQSVNDSQQFAIVDVVVAFGRGEHL